MNIKKIIFVLLITAPLFAQKNIALPAASLPDTYLIENPAYTVAFSGNYGIPIWEMHTLSTKVAPATANDKEIWKTDNRVKGYRLTPKDFEDTKLELVQLFPKEHAGDNQEFRESSLLTSNIVFMNKLTKEMVWDKITNSFQIIASRMKTAYLYAGPIFDKNQMKIKYIMNNKVAVPTYFFRIALYFDEGKPAYKCYRIPNRVPTDYERSCNIDEYEYNIYQLEADTGIDFFERELDANFRQDKLKFLEKQVR